MPRRASTCPCLLNSKALFRRTSFFAPKTDAWFCTVLRTRARSARAGVAMGSSALASRPRNGPRPSVLRTRFCNSCDLVSPGCISRRPITLPLANSGTGPGNAPPGTSGGCIGGAGGSAMAAGDGARPAGRGTGPSVRGGTTETSGTTRRATSCLTCPGARTTGPVTLPTAVPIPFPTAVSAAVAGMNRLAAASRPRRSKADVSWRYRPIRPWSEGRLMSKSAPVRSPRISPGMPVRPVATPRSISSSAIWSGPRAVKTPRPSVVPKPRGSAVRSNSVIRGRRPNSANCSSVRLGPRDSASISASLSSRGTKLGSSRPCTAVSNRGSLACAANGSLPCALSRNGVCTPGMRLRTGGRDAGGRGVGVGVAAVGAGFGAAGVPPV